VNEKVKSKVRVNANVNIWKKEAENKEQKRRIKRLKETVWIGIESKATSIMWVNFTEMFIFKWLTMSILLACWENRTSRVFLLLLLGWVTFVLRTAIFKFYSRLKSWEIYFNIQFDKFNFKIDIFGSKYF